MLQAINKGVLIPQNLLSNRAAHANIIQRCTVFADWMTEKGHPWYHPPLLAFAQYLQEERGLSNHSVNVYLSAVRSVYQKLLDDTESTKEQILQSVKQLEPDAELSSVLSEALLAMQVAANDKTARLEVERPEAQRRQLSIEQVENILNQPDVSTGKGLRDLAVLSTLFCVGLRDVELINLTIKDLYYHLNGLEALHVPDCSQCDERTIIYGGLLWMREVVEAWLRYANIQEGFVFRGLYRNGRPRDTKLSIRAIYDILSSYTLMIEEKPYVVSITDIRYTYARQLYLAGVSFDTIQHNLGHETKVATLDYIGSLDQNNTASPPSIYYYNPSKIPK